MSDILQMTQKTFSNAFYSCALNQVSQNFSSNWQGASIRSGNGLAQNKQQAITLTSDDVFCVAILHL